MHPGPYRILSLDGGGIRGVLTARLLERLDDAVPGFLGKVHLFAGTSTGSIIAAGLAAGMPPRGIRELYEKRGKAIFEDSIADDLRDAGKLAGADFDIRNLVKVFRRVFGKGTLGSLGRRVLIPAFRLDSGEDAPRRWKAKFFHNFPGDDSDAGERIADVLARSCAGPTYFQTWQGFVDGGLVANNPSMAAVAQTQDPRVPEPERPDLASVALLSLGTGQSFRYISGDHDWGYAQWAKPILPLIFDANLDVADFQCAQFLGRRYLRVAPAFPPDVTIELDDVGKIDELVRYADAWDLGEAVTFLRTEW